MKYKVYEKNSKVTLTLIDGKGKTLKEITPERSQKVCNHSPDGFQFGYHGSGPAQLALAILLDYTNSEIIAGSLYQQFKRDVIANMVHPGNEIDINYINQWVINNRL